MRRGLLVASACIALGMVMPLAAQDDGGGTAQGGSPYYYVEVPLHKVFPYRKGYVVTYRKGVSGTAQAYLPYEWFKVAKGEATPPKGEVIFLQPGTDWPHLVVYYKDGTFSHVRLYLNKERSHSSWGFIPTSVNLDDHFEGVEDLKLEF
jgi:hypothetical protein